MIETGRLKEMIGLGLRGLTSNPTIFDKAISSSSDYDSEILDYHKLGKSTFEIYDRLTIKDVQDAADLFFPVYKETDGLDGYVSLEINPKLAYMAQETIEEGRRLDKKVNRPNVMFKVPATQQGLVAIEELIASGINVNVTLIFSVEQYIDSAKAYIRGIERLSQNGGNLKKVRSVASVFVSRIDTLIDKLIDDLVAKERDEKRKVSALSMKGRAAVANSQLIYKNYSDIFGSEDFRRLQEKGTQLQRVLWGSTSTKNPDYSDIKYVSELIGRNTVNTMPEPTFYAFLDHGRVSDALNIDKLSDTPKVFEALEGFSIGIDAICSQLLKEGVAAFNKSFDSLLNSIGNKAVDRSED